MANDPFYIKQGDTREYLRRTLYNSDGTAMDLTGASVRFHMSTSGDQVLVDAAAVLIDAANGVVEYRWTAGDTDEVGEHKGEFEVTFTDSTIARVPNDQDIKIFITEQRA